MHRFLRPVSRERWVVSRAFAVAQEEYFKVTKANGVAQVIMNRPKKLNTMNDAFFDELSRSIQLCDEDPAMRCIVLSAEGKHFSAGLDLREAAAIFSQDSTLASKALFTGSLVVGKVTGTAPISPTESGMPAMRNQKLYRLIKRWQASISSLQYARLPVIAAIHGKCIGGAVDLVASADIRVCTRDAEFGVKEVNVGIVADLGTLHRIGRIVGRGLARELAFTGRSLKADRALSIGFVNEVYETPEQLLEGALRMAREIAGHSPLAVQGAKQVLNFADDHPLETGLEHVALWNSAFLKSDDLVQAVAAFLQKTKPQYRDYVLPKQKPNGPVPEVPPNGSTTD
eukprot:EG_transcript_11866